MIGYDVTADFGDDPQAAIAATAKRVSNRDRQGTGDGIGTVSFLDAGARRLPAFDGRRTAVDLGPAEVGLLLRGDAAVRLQGGARRRELPRALAPDLHGAKSMDCRTGYPGLLTPSAQAC